MKIYIRNRQRLIRVDRRRTARLLRKALRLLGLHRAELSVLFVNDRRMRILNSQHRGVDRTTDVLSFPQTSALIPYESRIMTHEFVLGDIVVNLHKTDRQAKEYGAMFNEELKRLLIHGLVHLLGYDHETGRRHEKKMLAKEKELFEAVS